MQEIYPRLSVDEALEQILAHVHPLEPERVPILEAPGRVLAEDVYAEYDVPPLSNSAMDGYAVMAADTAGATAEGPARLKVIHDLPAGYTTDIEVTPGTAIRIMTGAPVPAGADTVVPFEQTEQNGEWVSVLEPFAVEANIRRAGEDVRCGEMILARGAGLRAQEVGMLAALGRSTVLVIRRPRVGILATGDEVIDIDAPMRPGKIRNANSYSNAIQVLQFGGVPVMMGIARDDIDRITAHIRAGLDQGIDLLLTSGGISVGDFDVVKKVLAAEGEINFWQVKMRPGKPFAFGQIGGVPLLGLPGNPVSAMVSFYNFARPAILKMLGKQDLRPPMVRAILEEPLKKRSGFRFYYRVTLEERDGVHYARLTGEQGSGILLSMVRAQGLAVVPEDINELQPGDAVDVWLLN